LQQLYNLDDQDIQTIEKKKTRKKLDEAIGDKQQVTTIINAIKDKKGELRTLFIQLATIDVQAIKTTYEQYMIDKGLYNKTFSRAHLVAASPVDELASMLKEYKQMIFETAYELEAGLDTQKHFGETVHVFGHTIVLRIPRTETESIKKLKTLYITDANPKKNDEKNDEKNDFFTVNQEFDVITDKTVIECKRTRNAAKYGATIKRQEYIIQLISQFSDDETKALFANKQTVLFLFSTHPNKQKQERNQRYLKRHLVSLWNGDFFFRVVDLRDGATPDDEVERLMDEAQRIGEQSFVVVVRMSKKEKKEHLARLSELMMRTGLSPKTITSPTRHSPSGVASKTSRSLPTSPHAATSKTSFKPITSSASSSSSSPTPPATPIAGLEMVYSDSDSEDEGYVDELVTASTRDPRR